MGLNTHKFFVFILAVNILIFAGSIIYYMSSTYSEGILDTQEGVKDNLENQYSKEENMEFILGDSTTQDDKASSWGNVKKMFKVIWEIATLGIKPFPELRDTSPTVIERVIYMILRIFKILLLVVIAIEVWMLRNGKAN